MQHLDEGTVHAWLDGALPANEAASVEAHVATCAECSALVAEARGLIAGSSRIVSTLDVVRGDVVPKPKQPSRALWTRLHLSPSRAALAATLLIAVASLLVVRRAPTSRQQALLDQARTTGRLMSGPDPVVAITVQADSIVRPSPNTATPTIAATQPTPRAAAVTGNARALAAREADSMSAAPAKEPPMPSPPVSPAAKASAAPAAAAPVADAVRTEAEKKDAPAKDLAAATARRDTTARTTSASASAANVVTTGAEARVAPSAGASPVPPRGFDPRTLKPMDANPATQLPLRDSTRRIATGRLARLQDVSTSATGRTRDGPQCVMIIPDGSELSRALPDRFALTLTPDSARVVRLVGADGQIGAVIAGAAWRPFGVGVSRVDFPMTGTRFAPVMLYLRDGVLSAQASSASVNTNVGLRPINCHE